MMAGKSSKAWKRDSTAAGLSGLNVSEAAVGAMTVENFQKIPDPVLGVTFLSLLVLSLKKQI